MVIRKVAPLPTRRYEPPAPLPPTVPEPDPYRRPMAERRPPDESYEPAPRADDHPARGYRPPEESPVTYQRERDRRTDRTNLIANTIHVATALIALDFVLHIVFTLFHANQNSGFVAFVYGVAKVFVFGFGDVFTPGDATIGLVANYGLAAIVYLVVGRILYRTLRHG
ncbi:MAG TPA: hypothetical protein VFW65_40415 [Pseudonocardiaceae bacterium]|nr:hypothetical protein [Pseudonocardiaceae bacterium]